MSKFRWLLGVRPERKPDSIWSLDVRGLIPGCKIESIMINEIECPIVKVSGSVVKVDTRGLEIETDHELIATMSVKGSFVSDFWRVMSVDAFLRKAECHWIWEDKS